VLTLALDTTTRAGSVAVVRGASLLAVVHGDASRTHGERLPGEIDEALARAGIAAAELELLAVASGPGAFTGLRIGLAAIQGLALVLRVPVVAVSALDALACSVAADALTTAREPREPLTVATWMDAQRGEIFAAYYELPAGHADATPTAVPMVATPDVVLATLAAAPGTVFVGDGASRYREYILQATDRQWRVGETAPALAPAIAQIGMARAARGEAGPPHALQPLYVRRPDAELERQRREMR
jgi:tRNA threonylcarbamoyladenosine biosynthesis protein TsaB